MPANNSLIVLSLAKLSCSSNNDKQSLISKEDKFGRKLIFITSLTFKYNPLLTNRLKLKTQIPLIP